VGKVEGELAKLGIAPGPAAKSLMVGDTKVELTNAEWREYQQAIGPAMLEAAKRYMALGSYEGKSAEEREEGVRDAVREARDKATNEYKRLLARARGLRLTRGSAPVLGYPAW